MLAASRRLAPALVAGMAAACAEAPPPPAAAAKIEAPPPAPPPPAARWVESGGVTMIGPPTARGTLVLLGGRRALVLADGTLETEKTPAPEPLVDLVTVPVPGGDKLFGCSAHGLYRLDDPIGAPVTLARSEATITQIGAGPGVVAVWTERSATPRFLDVDTGKEHAIQGLPALPLRAVAFVDPKRGAGVFEVVGLAVTGDGGASWRVAPGAQPKDALAVRGVRRRGDALRAFAFGDGPDAAVDLDAARLGAMAPPSGAPTDPALLRWIRASGRDPLEAAASGGVDLPSGAALVASHGMIARIDPKTGAIGELLQLAHGKWVPCSVGRSTGAAWIGCTMSEGAAAGDLYDPFGVMRFSLDEPRLVLEKPVHLRNGDAELRVSPSGGVMLAATCKADEVGQACVRQPDGTWRTLAPDVDLGERGAGPLADGRLAFLRGLFDGDAGPEQGEQEDGASAKRLHVAIKDPQSPKERALAPIRIPSARGYVRVQSPIEEESDRSLHFVLEDGDGPYSVIVLPGQESPQVQRVPDAAEARLHAGRGIAVGEGHILASLDGGASWNDVPTSAAALAAARAIATGSESADTLQVSEIGARIGPVLRLGWGPPDNGTATPEVAGDRGDAPRLPPPDAPPGHDGGRPPMPPGAAAGNELLLRCAAAGASSGLPPLLQMSEVKPLLAGKPPAGKAPRRDANVWAARLGSMETVALMEDDTTDRARPGTWTFRWHDPREIGGRVRSASVKVPPGITGSSSLRYAASDGARALFVVRSGAKTRLVRARPGGAVEVAEVVSDFAPSGGVVFGAEKGEPIAWAQDTHVMAWPLGDAPRRIAEISTLAARTLGTPTAAGVPLLVGAADWSLMRTIPIPPADRAAPEKAMLPLPVPLDGWTRLPAIKRSLPALPACGARPKGARFSVERPGLRAEIDGVAESGSAALYDLRVNGGEVCVEGISAMLTVGRKGAPSRPGSPPPKVAKPAPGSGGAAFVRADLAGKKAEGGDRGLPPDAQVRRMKCALEGKN